jgi:hypothetical protein
VAAQFENQLTFQDIKNERPKGNGNRKRNPCQSRATSTARYCDNTCGKRNAKKQQNAKWSYPVYPGLRPITQSAAEEKGIDANTDTACGDTTE